MAIRVIRREIGSVPMNKAMQIVPVHAELFDSRVAEAIARESGAPIELAARIYNEELHDLACSAHIHQFVNVIATRRARLRLRRH